MPTRRRRSGVALIVALICLLVVTMMATVLVRVALAQREQLERDGWRRQADWLVLSARERALARSAADPGYTGETWLPAKPNSTTPLGRVEISILPNPEGAETAERLMRISVDVPDDPIDRAHVVGEWPISEAETSSDAASSNVVP